MKSTVVLKTLDSDSHIDRDSESDSAMSKRQ